jgi:hypothetical protein
VNARDINAYTKAEKRIEPLNVFKGHAASVGVRLSHPDICMV